MPFRKIRVLWWFFGLWSSGLSALCAAEACAALDQPRFGAPYVLYETRFEGDTMPTGWVVRGAWTVQEGLHPPAQGGYGCYAVWREQTSLERTLLEATIRLTDPQTRLGLVRQDLRSPRRGFPPTGTLALLDGVARQLRFLSAWDGTNQPVELASEPLPFALQTGHEYRLSLWKTDIGHHAFAILDPATGERAIVTALRTYTQDTGRQTDAPGFLLVSGEATLTRMVLSTVNSPSPRLLILGDSCAEGDSIKPYFDDRYASVVTARLQGDCNVASHSGESTSTVLSHLALDLDRFSPAYVLLPFSHMDPDFETWLAGMRRLIARVEARGAVPILATSVPLVTREPYAAAVTEWVRSSGYLYVDFAGAVCQEHDESTWEPTLVHADMIHPNRKGNRAIADRFLKDVPQLFDVPAAGCRRLRIPDTALVAGAVLRLPVELTALGNEWLVQFSLEFDPAVLAFSSASAASTLPPGTTFRQLTNSAALGRVGFRLQCPSEQAILPGTQPVVTVTFQSAGPSPFTQTTVRLDDRPAATLIAPLAVETHQSGTITLRGRRPPVAHWPFDGNGREATDPSLDGVLLGATPSLEPAGEALTFDGAGARVSVTPGPPLTSLLQATFSAWVKPTLPAGTRYLLTGEGASQDGIFFRLRNGRFEAGAWLEGRELAASAAVDASVHEWFHLAAVHNGWAWRLYRDGVALGEQAAPPPALDGLVEWTLGARRDGGGGFAGALSEVRFYDRALDSGEIAALALGGAPARPPQSVLLDDALPARSLTNEYGGEGWFWITNGPPPFNGVRAHWTPPHTGLGQHYFRRTDAPWKVEPGTSLFAYVYLDPAHPSRMALLQWLDGAMSWDHRAYWGDALWPYGEEAPVNRRFMGRLPAAGRWVRLEVPAAWVGLEGRSIIGMSFVLYDGAAAWDLAGIAFPEPPGDLFPLATPIRLPNGQVQIPVPTHPAFATHILGSPDLLHWTRLTTLAFPFANGVFVDGPAAEAPGRFYRVEREPR